MKLYINAEALDTYDKEKFLFTNYHNQIIPFIFYFRRRKFYCLVSKSKDGDISDYFLKRLGYYTIRGSSSDGGTEALYQIKNELKNNIVLSLPFDGPKGPVYKIKKGIIWLHSRNEYPLLLGYCYFSRAKRLGSWDGLYVPYPFSKVLIVIDGPVNLEKNISKEEILQQKLLMEEKMWQNYRHFAEKFRDRYHIPAQNLEEIGSEEE